MAETMPFTIGTEARCSDGVCGEVSRVVVDPVARTLTHLVVEPIGREGLGRLVPLDLVDASPDEVRLSCTIAEFEKLDSAAETQFVPGSGGYAAYGPEQVVSWPYYGLAGAGGPEDIGAGLAFTSPTVTYDAVPLGEVAVHRDDPVHAADGSIGRVQGLVIDPRNHHVTHVLLQEGHLWGRKEVAIPIKAVTEVSDEGIKLSIAKRDVEDLPPVDIDHPGDGPDRAS
ncbi:MAG TPA: PRC-barrel domain-containing protein [Streptosporangiaceae bacterium]|nr:PRC-barrel domain-containing protein [Streptosporangiaceae bacterium]